jgi:hypothetical protein
MSARKFDGKSGKPVSSMNQAALLMAEHYGVPVRAVKRVGVERLLHIADDSARRLLLGVSTKEAA